MDKEKLRRWARERLEARFRDHRLYRLAWANRFGLKERIRNLKVSGRATACMIATARKAGPLSDAWIEVIDKVPGSIKSKVYPAMYERLDAVYRKLQSGEWRPVAWTHRDWFRYISCHCVHQSTVDPNMVAYYPSFRHFMEEREVRTRPGRYLQQFFSDKLSEKDIREEANAQLFLSKATELNFVENDDPDGWEWVYEHGHGFKSCMTYDRSDRYLDDRLYGDDHPVRIYARKGNGLRLAWLGGGYKQNLGQVFARAIVRNDEEGNPLGYIRIYGDDSQMLSALEKAGYGDCASLNGVKLTRHEVDGRIVCPYLDSGNITVYDDYLKVTYSGVDTDSTGWLEGETCEDCGCTCSTDDYTWVGRDEDCRVCDSCRDNYYTYVHGCNGNEYYLHNDSVTWVDGRAYDENYLGYYDISECCICGENHPEDEMDYTKEGYCCSDCVTRLDIEDSEGSDYAPDRETITDPDGDTIRKDESLRDFITREMWHQTVMVCVDGNWIHPTTLQDNPERFRVQKIGDGYFLKIDADEGPLVSDDDFSDLYFRNISGDGDLYDALLMVAPDEPTPEISLVPTREPAALEAAL